MIDPYDTLMDHLAALAVEAVQYPEMAVQAYWLAMAAWHGAGTASWTLGMLLQQSTLDTTLALPDWAQGLAAPALVGLLQQRRWLETPAPLPAGQGLTWAELARYGPATLRWRDAYQPYVSDIRDTTVRLWGAVGHLYGPGSPGLAALPDEVRRGVVLFEAGLYFACHEYFETLWGRTADAASDLYQGIIQIAVAMRHLESHNIRGGQRLLRYGMGRLQRYPAVYKGLQLTAWLARLETLLEHLETLPSPAAYQFDPTQVPRLVPLE
jgi:predicted metal-dependent hydrolase